VYGQPEMIVEQITSGGTVSYLHHDQAGSTRLITGSSGTVTRKCTYSAYGAPTCEGTTTTPLGFDGQYTSSDTGLIYMRARVYHPTTAQFLSVDPLASITQEPYGYAGDNPLTYSDRSGLSLEEVLEGGSLPCPWCSAAKGAQEALEGAFHAAHQGIGWVESQLGTQELGEPAEQGAGAARDGCELLEKDASGKIHTPPGVSLPRYPPASWTDEQAEQVAEDLRDSIARRQEAARDLGQDSEHRERINEEEQLLRSIEKKLSGS
jgi:RHS repeat-associated protein